MGTKASDRLNAVFNTNAANQLEACEKCGAHVRQDCMADHLMAHQFEEDANEDDAQIQMQINMIDENVRNQQQRISDMDQLMVQRLHTEA